MALHTALPIYATGGRLLTLAIHIQVQLPRAVKRALGDKVTTHCIDMLNAMALANASMRPRIVTTALRRIEDMPAPDVVQAVNSYMGLLRQSPAAHHQRALIANAARKRGHCVDAALTKAFNRGFM